MKTLLASASALALALFPAVVFAGQPSPLSMQIDRTANGGAGPYPICANPLSSLNGQCDPLGTMSASGVFTPNFPPQSIPVGALPFTPVNRAGDNGLTGMISSPAAIPLDLTYSGAGKTACGQGIENVVAWGAGNAVAFDPSLSCILTPSADHQRTSLLVSATSQIDAEAEEQTLALHSVFNTGFKKPYAASTQYNIGDNVSVGGANYRACPAGASTLAACPSGITSTAAGSTGANSAPPASHPSSLTPPFFTDGTVTWLWINDAAIDGKLGFYNEVTVRPGTGAAWNTALNFQMQSGVIPSGDTGLELDFTNSSGKDCALGTNCNGIIVSAHGTNRSTSGVYVDGGNNSTDATSGGGWIWGFRATGNATGADFESDSFSANALQITNQHGNAIHDTSTGNYFALIESPKSQPTIDDKGASPASLFVEGNKSLSDLLLGGGTSVSAAGIVGGGQFTSAFIRDGSTNTPIGIDLSLGKYSNAAILGPNSSKLDGNGNFVGQTLTALNGLSVTGVSPTFVNAATMTFGPQSTSTVERFVFGSTITAGQALIDMLSSGSANSYDGRIQVSGGVAGTNGAGTMALLAGSISLPPKITSPETFTGAVNLSGGLTVNGASPTFTNASTFAIGNGGTSTVVRTIIGSLGTPGESDVDLNSSGLGNAYDVRLQATGGTSGQGNGTATLYAGTINLAAATVKFGTYTAASGNPSGYITIVDSGGTTRHLAVVP